MNNRGQAPAEVLIVFFTVTALLIGGIWCLSKKMPHRTKRNGKTYITKNVPAKVERLKPSCNDHGKCQGRYAMTMDGDNWFFYYYTFQGTDSSSYRSIPSTGWERGRPPEEEEIDENVDAAETEVTVESESADSGSDSGSDSGGGDSGGDGGGGD